MWLKLLATSRDCIICPPSDLVHPPVASWSTYYLVYIMQILQKKAYNITEGQTDKLLILISTHAQIQQIGAQILVIRQLILCTAHAYYIHHTWKKVSIRRMHLFLHLNLIFYFSFLVTKRRF